LLTRNITEFKTYSEQVTHTEGQWDLGGGSIVFGSLRMGSGLSYVKKNFTELSRKICKAVFKLCVQSYLEIVDKVS